LTDLIDPFLSEFSQFIGDENADCGILNGKTVAVKDNIDIKGMITGGGNPLWAQTHPAAEDHAPCIRTMLASGAMLAGKTHLDELAFSLMGINHHYGTPQNHKTPQRVPGGSSSGSASAVSAGRVCIALGTDTGGSVRLPASFCGIFGLRPTHGVISTQGVIPLAPSYDTVGFFTDNLQDMASIVALYFDTKTERSSRYNFKAPEDLWSHANRKTCNSIFGHFKLEKLLNDKTSLLSKTSGTDWSEIFRVHQSREVWLALGEWISKNEPEFGPGLKERFEFSKSVTDLDFKNAIKKRAELSAIIDDYMEEESIIILPTAPGPAPLLNDGPELLNDYRKQAIQLLCMAGHAGLPQLSIPGALVDGAPVGLSLIGCKNDEQRLIDTARFILGGIGQ